MKCKLITNQSQYVLLKHKNEFQFSLVNLIETFILCLYLREITKSKYKSVIKTALNSGTKTKQNEGEIMFLLHIILNMGLRYICYIKTKQKGSRLGKNIIKKQALLYSRF